MTATIAEQIRHLADTMATQPPNGAIRALAPVRANLAAAEMPDGVTDVGLIRPDAGLLHPHGSATTLHAALGDRAPPQVFCWGAWCRCGTIALRRYQAELVTGLTSRGVGLAAVCRSALDGSVDRHEKNELASTSLAGPREQLSAMAGILFSPWTEAHPGHQELRRDGTARNADGAVEIPTPRMIIANGQHVSRGTDVRANYSISSEQDDILGHVATR